MRAGKKKIWIAVGPSTNPDHQRVSLLVSFNIIFLHLSEVKLFYSQLGEEIKIISKEEDVRLLRGSSTEKISRQGKFLCFSLFTSGHFAVLQISVLDPDPHRSAWNLSAGSGCGSVFQLWNGSQIFTQIYIFFSLCFFKDRGMYESPAGPDKKKKCRYHQNFVKGKRGSRSAWTRIDILGWILIRMKRNTSVDTESWMTCKNLGSE